MSRSNPITKHRFRPVVSRPGRTSGIDPRWAKSASQWFGTPARGRIVASMTQCALLHSFVTRMGWLEGDFEFVAQLPRTYTTRGDVLEVAWGRCGRSRRMSRGPTAA